MMPIAIKQATHKRLLGLRLGRESYDSLINRLADCHEEAFARPTQTTGRAHHSHKPEMGGDTATAAAHASPNLPHNCGCRAAAPADPNVCHGKTMVRLRP